MSDLSDKKKSGYRRLLIPALVLLAAAGLLYVLRFNPHSLEAIRGPWNERWWLILGLQIGWITCASLGGVLLILWLGNVTSPALAVTLLVILPIFAVILFPIFERAREGGGPHCMGYQRQLAYAVLMYTQDHVMIFPGNANEAFASIKPMFRACPMTQRHPYRPWAATG